jgi:hypothetical protein
MATEADADAAYAARLVFLDARAAARPPYGAVALSDGERRALESVVALASIRQGAVSNGGDSMGSLLASQCVLLDEPEGLRCRVVALQP